MLPTDVTLDEWGYPIFHTTHFRPEEGERAIRMCPRRALSWAMVLERRAG